MGEDRPPSSAPPPGQPYGSDQGAPPPASHPYGSPAHDPSGSPLRDHRPSPSREWEPAGPPARPPELWEPPPAPPPPTPEQIALAGRLIRLALMSAVAAPLVALLRLPYTAVLGLGLGVLAIVLGVRARRAAAAARRSEAGGVVAIVLGSIGTAFITVVVAFYLVFWGEIRAYEDCMSGANTVQAKTACSDQLLDAARRRVGLD